MDPKTAGQKKKNRLTPTQQVEVEAHTLRSQGRGEIISDVLGGYTGTPEDGGVPSQDADDL